MEKIGVAAVVEGLSEFMGGMGKMDSAIQGLLPTSKLLGGAFDWLGGIVSNFVSGAARILEYTLGGLIKDAIEKVIGAIQNLISEVIKAGSEFQTLELRLTGLNLPAQADQIKNWTKAMADAKQMTREELDWLQALASATPFDATDIATAYSLARSYGFTDKAARRLTQDITDFASGMGLSSQAILTTIQNLGQMDQRGKITGTAIRNLTRSAFLPLDDVLSRIAKTMKISVKALTKMISTADGVPADLFITAFEQMVEEEPRFIGAAGRLGRTFAAATNNVADLFRNIGGLNIVAPILDVLGEHVARLVDEFVYFTATGDLIKTDKWVALSEAAALVGTELSRIINQVLGIFIPQTSNMADGMINSLNGISLWLALNREKIFTWARKVKEVFVTQIVPAVKNVLKWLFGSEGKKGAIEKFGEWLKSSFIPAVGEVVKWVGGILSPILENLGPIFAALYPLGQALVGVLGAAFGGKPDSSFSDWITGTLIPAIQSLTKWINDNQALLAFLIKMFIIGAVAVTILSAAVAFLFGVFSELTVAIIGWAAIGLAAVVGWAVNTWTAFNNWFQNTYDAIVTWGINVGVSFAIWSQTTLQAIIDWGINTLMTMITWASNTTNAIVTWTTNTYNSIVGWVGSVISAIVNWAATMLTQFSGFSTTAQGSILTFTIGALEYLVTFGVNAVKAILNAFKDIQSGLKAKMAEIARMLQVQAQNWVTYIIDGFKNKAGEIIEALNSLIGEIQSGIKNLVIGVTMPKVPSLAAPGPHSPTHATGTHNTFRTVPEGFGNDSYKVGLTSGEKYMVIPKGGQMSSAMAGSSVNSTMSVLNNFNLNIHSSAPTEPIIADFGMMQSMVGTS